MREYTKGELEEMADRESERRNWRLRTLGIDPEGDPIDIMMEVFRLHKELEARRALEP